MHYCGHRPSVPQLGAEGCSSTHGAEARKGLPVAAWPFRSPRSPLGTLRPWEGRDSRIPSLPDSGVRGHLLCPKRKNSTRCRWYSVRIWFSVICCEHKYQLGNFTDLNDKPKPLWLIFQSNASNIMKNHH